MGAACGWYEGAQSLLAHGAGANFTNEVRMCELIEFSGEFVEFGMGYDE